MGKKNAVKMKVQSYSGKIPMSGIRLLSESKQACKLSCGHENALVWLFSTYTNDLSLARIEARLT